MTTKIPVELSSTPGIVDGSNATAITINSSEQVGIGTTSPSRPLEVLGTATDFSSEIKVNNSSSASGAHGAIQFVTEGESTGLIIGKHSSGFSEADLAFVFNELNTAMQFGTNNTERMRISSAGNVGIGTTTPSSYDFNDPAKLVVANTSGHSTISIVSGTSSNGYLAFADGTSGTARYSGSIQYSHASHYMSFQTSDGTERMRINGSGHLLIGTSDASTSGSGFKFIDSSTEPYMVTSVDTSSNHMSNYHHYNQNASYNGYRFYIRNNGGVVNYSGNNVNLSDEKVKTNIELSGNYLEKICNIPVKLFNYKDEPEGVARSLGVIAQDVEAVAPELVNNEGFGDTPEDGVPLKTIYTTDMMYALMKSIQEQQDIIEDLKSRIETLEE